MIHEVTLTKLLGFPLVGWLGILAYLSFLFTASIGFTNYHSIKFIPFKWHPVMAAISFAIATIFGFTGLSIIFGF